MKVFFSFLVSLLCSLLLIGCEKHKANTQVEPSPNTNEVIENATPTDTMNLKMEDNETTARPIFEKDKLPILFSLNGLYGYADKNLQVIIPPIYIHASRYTDHGYASVRYKEKDGEWLSSVLDVKGNTVFSYQTAGISIYYDDLICYRSNDDGLYKVVRFRTNSVVVSRLGGEPGPSENDIILARQFDNNEWSYFNSAGERILPNLKLRRMTRGFYEERAVIMDENWNIRIIDIDGNYYGDLDFFRTGRQFSEGLLAIETKDGRTGYINREGEFAFFVPIFADNPDNDESPLHASDFKDGRALVQTVFDPPVWRVINTKGEYTSDEITGIISAGPFSEGLTCARTNDYKFIFIDKKGEMIFDTVFDSASSFSAGYARIIYEGRDGLINTEGKIFWSDEIVKPKNTNTTGLEG